MAYSTVDDLLLGDVPLSAALSREKFIADAADEIDSYIGSKYVTPIDMTDTGPVLRHSRVLIKRISNFLATGRLILAVDAGGEDTSVHAYGRRLINEALDALREIRDGIVTLDGAPEMATNSDENGPTISNTDAASAVDAFYDRVMSPEKLGWPYRDWAPGATPTIGVP